jgi:CheY-like chemotaxis protein
MNNILVSPATPTRSKGRLLAIEPDSSRARTLRQILSQHDDVEFEIVDDVSDALWRIGKRMPDLVLISTLLPPADEAPLTAQLKQIPAAAHVQLINIPYFIDMEDGSSRETSSTRVLSFLRGRESRIRPRCDVRTLRQQIDEYLSQAKAIRQDLEERQFSLALAPIVPSAHAQKSPERWLTRAIAAPALTAVTESKPALARSSALGMPSDRRRARRSRAGDVPWLWNVKLPGISRVNLVDISSGGVLLETTSRIVDGSTIELQLLGEDTNVSVPARMLRNQVAAVDGLGVRYHVAAAFTREVDLLKLQTPTTSSLTPKALGEVLARVLSEVDRSSGTPALRSKFEQEVRRLFPVRDIQIRQTPMIVGEGTESIYFTVPNGSGGQPILQAIFERDYEPTAMEFQLLKTAATMAAVVLEFAPLSD